MTRENQNNVGMDSKHNLKFCCGHKKRLVVFPVAMIHNGPKHYDVILKFSKGELLSFLAELKVKNNFLLKAIRIKHLNE